MDWLNFKTEKIFRVESPVFLFIALDAEWLAATLPKLAAAGAVEAGRGAEAMAEMWAALLNYEGVQGWFLMQTVCPLCFLTKFFDFSHCFDFFFCEFSLEAKSGQI